MPAAARHRTRFAGRCRDAGNDRIDAVLRVVVRHQLEIRQDLTWMTYGSGPNGSPTMIASRADRGNAGNGPSQTVWRRRRTGYLVQVIRARFAEHASSIADSQSRVELGRSDLLPIGAARSDLAHPRAKELT